MFRLDGVSHRRPAPGDGPTHGSTRRDDAAGSEIGTGRVAVHPTQVS